MFDFKLNFCSAHFSEEHRNYKTPCHYIVLYISGMDFWKAGELLLQDPKPYLGFITADTMLDFHMTDKRENWVIGFNSPDLCESDDARYIRIKINESNLRLPKVEYIDEQELGRIRNIFVRIREEINFPDPASRMFAELQFCSLVSYILEKNMKKNKNTPAARFKNYIDDDKIFKRNLSELSDKCGYSCDHMRILFEKEFGIAPLEYRNRYRLSLVNDLIANTDFSVKEIAFKLGFKHVSHLSALYKKQFGITPKEGIKSRRYYL